MREVVTSIGESPAVGDMLYSVGSGVVHSNPILVDLALDQITPAAGQYAAALRIKTALRFHHLLMGRIAKWTDWETDGNWFDELERICQVLLIRHLHEMESSLGSTGDLHEFQQHLSKLLELMQDRKDEDSP